MAQSAPGAVVESWPGTGRGEAEWRVLVAGCQMQDAQRCKSPQAPRHESRARCSGRRPAASSLWLAPSKQATDATRRCRQHGAAHQCRPRWWALLARRAAVAAIRLVPISRCGQGSPAPGRRACVGGRSAAADDATFFFCAGEKKALALAAHIAGSAALELRSANACWPRRVRWRVRPCWPSREPRSAACPIIFTLQPYALTRVSIRRPSSATSFPPPFHQRLPSWWNVPLRLLPPPSPLVRTAASMSSALVNHTPRVSFFLPCSCVPGPSSRCRAT